MSSSSPRRCAQLTVALCCCLLVVVVVGCPAGVMDQQQQQAVAFAQMQAQMHAAQQEIARLNGLLAAASSSSSSSLSLPAPGAAHAAHGSTERMKPMKPSTFTGGAGNPAEQWLAEVERYFLAAGVEDRPGASRVLFASTFLKDSASAWLNSLWPENEREQGLRDCTWADFKEKFRARYRPLAAERTARMLLRTLKQRSRVAGYSDAFLKQAQLLPNMDEADKVAAYIDGLLPKIAEEVDRDDPQTLVDAMNLAQRAEIRQASRSMARQAGFSRPYYSANQPAAFYHRSGGTSTNTNTGGGDPMDLSMMVPEADAECSAQSESDDERSQGIERVHVMQQRGGQRRDRPPPRRGAARVPDLSRDEYDRLSREGKCFQCRQPGHLARNCPRNNGPVKSASKPTQAAPTLKA
jgi:hypothetical protein